MTSQCIVASLVLGLAAAAAAAQEPGALRWRSGAPLGLQPGGPDANMPCGPISLSCAARAVVPLYTNALGDRSVSMQVGAREMPALKAGRPQGPTLNVVGRAGLPWDLGVYGRVGTSVGRSNTLAYGASTEGLSYGVGVSWDFSRSASAILGYDSYDVRGLAGELRDVRATSLGLQWRY